MIISPNTPCNYSKAETEDMIPKIIHYCWFGRNPKPMQIQKCIQSWSKHCSEFRFIEWTEDNFDLKSSPLYVQQAYSEKKWAFVADYVRFYALVKYGGIYMDADMELLKPLTPFLHHHAFTSTEDGQHISAGIMGCIPGFKLYQTFMEHYKDKSFYRPDGSLDTTTVVVMMTEKCLQMGYKPVNTYQEFAGLAVYPSEYFYPLSHIDDVMRKTENTYAVHWFAGSWVSREEKKAFRRMKARQKIKRIILSLIGEDGLQKLRLIIHRKK